MSAEINDGMPMDRDVAEILSLAAKAFFEEGQPGDPDFPVTFTTLLIGLLRCGHPISRNMRRSEKLGGLAVKRLWEGLKTQSRETPPPVEGSSVAPSSNLSISANKVLESAYGLARQVGDSEIGVAHLWGAYLLDLDLQHIEERIEWNCFADETTDAFRMAILDSPRRRPEQPERWTRLIDEGVRRIHAVLSRPKEDKPPRPGHPLLATPFATDATAVLRTAIAYTAPASGSSPQTLRTQALFLALLSVHRQGWLAGPSATFGAHFLPDKNALSRHTRAISTYVGKPHPRAVQGPEFTSGESGLPNLTVGMERCLQEARKAATEGPVTARDLALGLLALPDSNIQSSFVKLATELDPDFEKNRAVLLDKLRGGPEPERLALQRTAMWNDKVAQGTELVDALDVEHDAQAFARLFLDQSVPPPLAVGLFGRWGSGKTFFMRLIERAVTTLAAQARVRRDHGTVFHGRVAQIWFNAWHYAETDLWASLVDNVYGGLARTLGEPTSQQAAVERQELENEQAQAQLARQQAQTEFESAQTAEREAVRALEVQSEPQLASIARWQTALDTMPQEVKEELLAWLKRNKLDDQLPTVEELRAIHGGLQKLGALRHAASRLAAANKVEVGLLLLIGLLLLWAGLKFDWYPIAKIVPPLAAFLVPVIRFAPKALKMADRITPLVTWVADTVAQPSEHAKARHNAAQARLAEANLRLEAASRRLAQANEAFAVAKSPKGFAELVRGRIASGKYETRLGIVSAVRRDLEQLQVSMQAAKAQAHETAGAAAAYVDRIVLYIDDLDRCPPEKVVDVLEAVHLLLHFELFVVVVGVDTRWVTRCLMEYYPLTLSDEHGNLPGRYAITLRGNGEMQGTLLEGAVQHKANGAAVAGDGESGPIEDLATPHDYLEKIFQVPYWLPAMDRKGSASLLDKLSGAPVSAAESLSELDRQVDQLVREERKAADAEIVFAAPPDRTAAQAVAPATPADSGEEQAAESVAQAGPEPATAERVQSRKRAQMAADAIEAASAEVPQSLALFPRELEYLRGLAPYAGDSPRRLKRFLNMYRYIRATLDERLAAGFMVGEGAAGSYQAMAAILALVTGVPKGAPEVFQTLEKYSDPSESAAGNGIQGTLDKLALYEVDRRAAKAILHYFAEKSTDGGTVASLVPWIHRVARFTYRSGRIF